jgi:hypothetical protein
VPHRAREAVDAHVVHVQHVHSDGVCRRQSTVVRDLQQISALMSSGGAQADRHTCGEVMAATQTQT